MGLRTRIGEYLGWCPHSEAFMMQQPRSGPGSFNPVTVPAPGQGPVTHGGGEFHYRHTQIGRIQVWASIAAIIIITLSVIFLGSIWISIAVIVFLGGAILLFGSLTVRINRRDLQIRFGPFGIIKRIVPLVTVKSVSVVRTPWYYGWGIRWTPDGPLYNMAGQDGVEVILRDGKKFRIGTDEPAALAAAIAGGLL